ncbi:MFS transporter [Pleomorphomonas oryzae]|uniref:MFS transporter n=1 Tax=Pleomorphomonas oryzae TaxID=261934 RepID=UPI000410D3AB|nr:MFS transporter [Pleomorphomonas oryzae]
MTLASPLEAFPTDTTPDTPPQKPAETAPEKTPEKTYVVKGSAAYRRISLALFLAGFSTFSLLYAIQPLLPSLVQHYGVSPAESSLALSLTTGSLAVAIMLAGAFSESFGRRGMMFWSMLGAALCHIGAALSPDWHLLLALRAAEGFILGGVPAVAMAYLAEEIDPRCLGTAMGLYVGGVAFGGMAGRVGVGLLLEICSWRTALTVLGGLDLIAAIGFALLLPPSRHFIRRKGMSFADHGRTWLGHLATPGLPLVFLCGFLALGSFVATFNYLTFRLSDDPFGLSPGAISAIFLVYISGVFASPLAGVLADRYGRMPAQLSGVAVMAAGTLMTLSSSLVMIVLGLVGVTGGFFIIHAVASGWVGRLARGSKGHASSLYLLAYYAGSSSMGSGGGWVWSLGGWPAIVGLVSALLGLTLIATLRIGALAEGA